eukprot:m.290394 g.290394  ORF g.290394 m.290394 type:complete len:162 (+) comp19466_c1_seq4:1048-1533(+)
MAQLFQGVPLQAKDGSTVDASVLAGRQVGIYFSAHWCPPCREFTPQLAMMYEEVTDEEVDRSKRPFEVVFVSSDVDEAAAKEYLTGVHGDWLMLPFGHELQNKLKQRYGACAGKEQADVGVEDRKSGIPCLAIIKEDGELITLDGVSDVQSKGPAALAKWK